MSRFICFILGAGLGGVVVWYGCKEHYQRIADEEIQSVREAFTGTSKKEETQEANSNAMSLTNKTDHRANIAEYNKLLKECEYNRVSPKETLIDCEETSESEQAVVSRPYVITPEEFDTLENYDVIIFTYYADGVLVDEDNAPLTSDEIFWSVGEDFATHFGEYEDDSVHIRNDLRQTDYEILKVLQRYGDLHEQQ